jgi:hypothetical protein
MAYRKAIYVTVLHKDKVVKRYATYTIKTIADKLRLVYGIEINKSRVFDELPSPATIYKERTGAYQVEIFKLVLA